MPSERISHLTDCSEFRQTLLAKPPAMVHGVAVILTVLLVSAGAWAFLTEADLVVRGMARVRPLGSSPKSFTAVNGDPVLTAVSGRVAEVAAKVGDSVKKGDVLVRLETERQENEIARQKRRIETIEQELRSVSRMRKIPIATAARRDVKRLRALSRRGAIARVEVDAAMAKVNELELRHEELQARAVAKQGELATARRELAALEIERAAATTRAPDDGFVTQCDVKVGEIVEAHRTVAALASQQGLRVDVAVSDSDIGEIRAGLPVRLKVDAYDFQRYGTAAGRIESVSPDTQVMDTPGGGRMTYYLVRVLLESDDVIRGQHRGVVKLGMTGQAEIVVGREALLTLLVRSLRHSISIES